MQPEYVCVPSWHHRTQQLQLQRRKTHGSINKVYWCNARTREWGRIPHVAWEPRVKDGPIHQLLGVQFFSDCQEIPPKFYGTRRIIAVFVQLTIYPRCRARSIQSLNINLLSSHPRLGLPNDLFSLGFAVFSFAIRATCLNSPALISPPREHLVGSANYAAAHDVIPVSSLSVPPPFASRNKHP